MFGKRRDAVIPAETPAPLVEPLPAPPAPAPARGRPAYFGPGFAAEGAIAFDGQLDLEGQFNGDIRAARLIIGPTGRCEGTVVCDSLVVKGHFSGAASCRELEVHTGAHLMADVTYEEIRVTPRARISGRLIHRARYARQRDLPRAFARYTQAPSSQARSVFMKQLSSTLLKGLLTILPISLTLYFAYWLGVTTESLLSVPLKMLVSEAYYWPGMGVIAGMLCLLVVGLLVNAYLVRRLIEFGERLLMRVPVLKTIYGAVRDLTSLVRVGDRGGELQRVVLVDVGPGQVIGFVTQESASLPGMTEDAGLVAVYMPMSYQIGGYTLYLPRDRLHPTDLSVEQAMRIVLTGGLQNR